MRSDRGSPPKPSALGTGDSLRAGKPVSLKSRAVGLLARREYARAELAERLIADGASRDDVTALLDELAGRGLQSDERYARALVAHRAAGYSRHWIRAELKRRGVAPDAIDAVLADAAPDDEAALVALWQRRYGTLPSDERAKAQQVRFLRSRGFEVSAILKLLRSR